MNALTLPAFCKHALNGDPEFCSQCRGVVPKQCGRDPVTGIPTLDGIPIDRAFQIASEGHTSKKKHERMVRAKKAAADIAPLIEPTLIDEDE